MTATAAKIEKPVAEIKLEVLSTMVKNLRDLKAEAATMANGAGVVYVWEEYALGAIEAPVGQKGRAGSMLDATVYYNEDPAFVRHFTNGNGVRAKRMSRRRAFELAIAHAEKVLFEMVDFLKV